MMEDKVFEYKGHKITFHLSDSDTMVNATEMAKPFEKRPVDWVRLPTTESFIASLSEVRKSHITQLVQTIKGNFANGQEQGTWMHRDVAIEFARWLSPMLGIWCNDRIIELMKYGFTATDTTLDTLIANPELGTKLFSTLKEERERHAEELSNERECNKLQLAICMDEVRYAQELREDAIFRKISERRYFSIAVEQQRLLKQNNIPIPTNLKIRRMQYERDLKRLKV